MTTIRCVYEAEPKFPASDQHPNAVRYQIGDWWVDAIGGEPTEAEVLAVILPEPTFENISKNVIWERMTEQEAAQADALLKAQPPKVLRIYEGATYISTKAELYPQLLGAMTQLFGAERAAEILKPNF